MMSSKLPGLTGSDKPESRRMPAEWEQTGAVLMAWPHKNTDWAPILDDACRCFSEIAAAIVGSGSRLLVVTPDIKEAYKWLESACVDMSRVILGDIDTNDTWARDFGPITIDVDGVVSLVDFCFNGWGLKFAADHDNLVTRKLFESGILQAPIYNCLSFVLEGGSIESDGYGSILTTTRCLASLNRNGGMTIDEIEEYLKRTLGAKRILWLDHGALIGDDTDSHIDTLARLAPNDTIVYTGCNNSDDPHYDDLQLMKKQLKEFRTIDGHPYHILELPLPEAVMDPECGDRLPATYANYLVLPNAVLMPSYAQPDLDTLAASVLKEAYPDRDIVSIDCRTLVRQHGSLHCVTMQLDDSIIPTFHG